MDILLLFYLPVKFQEDFYAVVDWAYKIDPLRCISMHGITERYISGQKADAAGFVRILLDDLENRISTQFSRVSYYVILTTYRNKFLKQEKGIERGLHASVLLLKMCSGTGLKVFSNFYQSLI